MCAAGTFAGRSAELAEDDRPVESEGEEAPEGSAQEEARGVGAFTRCATCRNAAKINLERGTLLCERFNMFVDAEADEIPDNCLEYQRDAEKKPPPDPAKEQDSGEQ